MSKDKVATLRMESEDFVVEFESDLVFALDETMHIENGLYEVEKSIDECQLQIDKYDKKIECLTSQTDSFDITLAVASGILTGVLDLVLVKTWDFKAGKAQASEQINKSVIAFAKKHPKFEEYFNNHRTSNNELECAVKFLEKTFKLPGDGNYTQFMADGITHKTHHLDDYCHHPTIVGLISCILVQFSEFTKYHGVKGVTTPVPVVINEYGNFVSEETWGKVFAGIVNWFFKAGKTIINRKGHLMSDIAGSSNTAGAGAGLPGPIMSLLKEVSDIKLLHNNKFSEELRKVYQNGIGTGKSQVDLGVFNNLFEGASSKVDLRTELAFVKQLEKQANVVVLNEIIVRALYFVKYLIIELKNKQHVKDIQWKNVLPFRNRTIARMLTISLGTIEIVDLTEATICGLIKSGGNAAGFWSEFILHINFVGVGRFAIAVSTDVSMGVQREKERNKRINAVNEKIQLLDARVYYNQANMWIAASEAQKAFDETDIVRAEMKIKACESINNIQKRIESISENVGQIEKKNPGLVNELLSIFAEEGI